jgi:hypothetical protein
MFLRIAMVLALLGLGAACAGGAEQDGTTPADATPTSAPADASGAPSPSATSGPPLSSTELPTMTPPAAKPTEPSDRVGTRYLSGVVTRGGSGPCYGLRGDDGRQYALYNSEGLTLTENARIRARVAPLLIRIYCGPGEHLALVAFGPER